jgi:hypothetical protein
MGGASRTARASGPIALDPVTVAHASLHGLLAGVVGVPVETTHVATGAPSGALLTATALPDAARPRLVAGVACADGGHAAQRPAPTASRAALARAVAAYGALREWRVRAGRAGVAALAAAGRTGTPIALVGDAPGPAVDDVLTGLARAFGVDRVLWLAGVRAPGPWAKPTLQLFDERGAPLGYAKLGTNALTDACVRTERAALGALHGHLGPQLRVPALVPVALGGGRAVCATAPLPADARRPPARGLPGSLALAALAAAEVTEGAWGASPMAARLLEVPAAGCGTRALQEEVASASTVPVRTGWWHGDWVPWNLAVTGEATWAFDWEYAERGAPAGLDVVHHAFQRTLVARRRPLAEALDAAASVAGGLRRGARDRRLLVAVHRLALAVRVESARAAGLPDDPALAPLADGTAWRPAGRAVSHAA